MKHKYWSHIQNWVKLLGSSKVSFYFLTSYILLLILPISIFIFMLNNIYLSKLEDQLDNDNLHLVNTIGSNISNSLEGMRNITHQISNSPELSVYYLTDSPLNAKDGINQLYNFIYGQNIIDDIALVGENMPLVYTSKYAPRTEDFLDDIESIQFTGDALYEKFFNENGTFTPITRYVNNVPTKQVLYILRDESGSVVNRRAILIFLSQEKLNAILAVPDASLSLYDKQFTVISENGDREVMSQDQVTEIFANNSMTDGIVTDRGDGSEFISAYQLRPYGVTLVMTRPWNIVMGDIESVKYKSFLILGIMLLIGLLMIVIDMKILYMPIYRLKRFAENAMGGNDHAMHDEYEVLNQALVRFLNENSSMSGKLQNNQAMLRDKYILFLLYGGVGRQGSLEQAERDSGIHFPYEKFCTVLMLPSSTIDAEAAAIILRGIEQIHEGPFSIAGAVINQNECFGLILNFNGDYESNIQDSIRQLTEIMAANLECRLTVGAGSIYDNRTDIGRSYIEARTALDYKMIYGVGQIIFWNSINPKKNLESVYPYDLMKKLEMSLLDGNMDDVFAVVDRLIGSVKDSNVSLCNAKCFAYDMINTILKVINISGTEANNPALTEDILKNTVLSDFETIDELAASIKNTADRLCGIIMSNKTRYRDGLLGNIRRYIEENFSDYNFTVKGLACEFGMSESNISHYYKYATGHNISDYINGLRINKAKSLLVETELSIREIVENIGYCDVSSFTRKFRLAIGMSPGNYRETFAKKS